MRINLVCPFEERHSVKAAGGRWDDVQKVWYLIDPVSLAPFTKWLKPEVGVFLKSKKSAKLDKKSLKGDNLVPVVPKQNRLPKKIGTVKREI